MKVAQINTTCGVGSTGKICLSISRLMAENGIENRIYYSEAHSDYQLSVPISRGAELKAYALESRITGYFGRNARFATKRLLSNLQEFDPDIVHIHNIHGHSCDFEALFEYIKGSNKRVIWTFHDCWAFTGYCTYFSVINCNKWKNECYHCEKRKQYSWFFDRSKELFEAKKRAFTNVNMTIVTPSEWLASLVRQSFLGEYPIEIINNGIDVSIFAPIVSDFRAKHGIKDEDIIILGVAFEWGYRKGLDVFEEISSALPDNYRIVLVGTDEKIDKSLPKNIITIHRTNSQHELAEIYSTADVFLNPTREDNYPTVNMESIACGTPVITFATGGSPEMISDSTGIVVAEGDINGLISAIQRIAKEKIITESDCLESAKSFDQDNCFAKYINLYKKVCRDE